MMLCWLISIISVESYVKSLGEPALLDLVVLPTAENGDMMEVEDLRPSKKKLVYSEVQKLFVLCSASFHLTWQ